jgi:excinuclease UvrABC nuclease subunit
MQYGWTLDKGAWTKLITATRNRAWRRVSFSRLEKGQVPTEGGVYVFCAKPMSASFNTAQRHLLRTLLNAVYVGQAVNLRQRFDDHLRAPMDPMRAARAVFSTTLEFWFTRASSTEEMCELESLLIECLGPPANRQRGPTLKGTMGEGRPA